ncbi:hypothetical protein DVH24_014032 [Malus domestica]|uniref:DUF4216 domain-containing protein n=1 Tax=Malus domestica TaxID=3750 RepID=A0A498JEA1_MALDO|nr:hypothetical protein DVH24_014032 [Malus domestica]
MKHDYLLISVNTNTPKQVFYVADPKAGNGWKVIQRIQHRNVWDIPKKRDSEGDNSNDDLRLTPSLQILGLFPRIDENEFIYNYNEESSTYNDDYISNEENSTHDADSSSSTIDDDSDLDY